MTIEDHEEQNPRSPGIELPRPAKVQKQTLTVGSFPRLPLLAQLGALLTGGRYAKKLSHGVKAS